jgi:glycosyltransferase involved in cell wall biosynthesis
VVAALAGAGIGLATFRAHPLRIHAAPLKVLEYMASGLPIIALKGSEAGDMVTRAGVGVTCATTGADIAQAVRRMMDDPAAYAAMSAAGPGAAAAYDWGTVLSREREMLAQLYGLDLKASVP